MKISARISMIISAIFAVACFSIAITGFTSLGDIADAGRRAEGWGYAWFWTFLGAVGVVFGLVSWWMVRTHQEEE